MSNSKTIKIKNLRLLYIFVLLVVPTLFAAPTYEDLDGLIVMDAEKADPAAGWVETTDILDYTGTGGLIWAGAKYPPGGTGILTYNFKINKTGRYRVQYRARTGDGTHEHNDCYIKLSTGTPKLEIGGNYTNLNKSTWYQMFVRGEDAYPNWFWGGILNIGNNTLGAPYIDFDTPGQYKIQFSARSKNFAIDRIILTHAETYKGNNPQWHNELSETIGGVSDNIAPVAKIKATPTSGEVNLKVSFNGKNSSDSDGSIQSYSWDFGDGNTASGKKTSHTYKAEGTYNAELTVTDDKGATGSANITITATSKTTNNNLPVAKVSATPTSGKTPITVSFSGTNSSDSDGTIESYSWDFGNGNSGSGENPSHTYKSAGTFNAILTVTDDKGGVDTASVKITLTGNEKPKARIKADPQSGNTPLIVNFNGNQSVDTDGSITQYEWDFGDGQTGTGKKITHTYNGDGDILATLTVTDNEGATHTAEITISANNIDRDGDGILNEDDVAIDGTTDLSRDFDNDGIDDSVDKDIDGDGIINVKDIGVIGEDLSNDADNDGILNLNDDDDDNDGVTDIDEAKNGSNPIIADTNGDGIFDTGILSDQDGDGIIDDLDPYPAIHHEKTDLDGDSILDIDDNDIDGDGIANDQDSTPYDADGDGIYNNHDSFNNITKIVTENGDTISTLPKQFGGASTNDSSSGGGCLFKRK